MNLAHRLHENLVRRPRIDWVAQALVDLVPSNVLARDTLSVLDVGAGDGRVGQRVAGLLSAAGTRTSLTAVDTHVQKTAAVKVTAFDGTSLPFPDRSFDIVLLSDVVHHALSPSALVTAAVRVTRSILLIKDHFAFGHASRKALHWLDLAGNHSQGIAVTGTYLAARDWDTLIRDALGEIAGLRWPVKVHSIPFSWLIPETLQFAMAVRPRTAEGALP